MAYYATYMPDETGELQRVVINAGVGFVLPYYGETAPPGTLACDGSEISRTVYDELFAVLGTKAGAGNGTTTFNLPDLRGQFVRGTGGNAAALGTEQGDAIRNIIGKFNLRPVYNTQGGDGVGMVISVPTSGSIFAVTMSTIPSYTLEMNNISNTYYTEVSLDVSRVLPTSIENRPTNMALLWCIIYE